MSLGSPAALMNNSTGPVDNTQYDPINKWRAISFGNNNHLRG
ncbi:MAG: hypothetical protein QN720_07685 [Nitrososphaeraceae archaeon]|nr:hypothetical protein [Nitrososphaeraceae archaeon]MDW0332872.1 hypothetical protein [Nitrososphaeraceae archaeon]